jgi:putative restriction endonuclease
VLATEAHGRTCAITRERALPALETAHICPFAELETHSVRNGLLLRSDLHRLFDACCRHGDTGSSGRGAQADV